MNEVTLILSIEEAERWKLFQKYYDIIALLEGNDVLNIGFGKVTLNFGFNELQTIVKEQVVYKR